MLQCETPISPLSVTQEEVSSLVIQTAAAYRPIVNNYTETVCYAHPNSTTAEGGVVIRTFKCPRGSVCAVGGRQEAWLNMEHQV